MLKLEAVYGNPNLTISLVNSVGIDRFDADTSTYRRQLKELFGRAGSVSDPEALRALCGVLGIFFERQVIEKCRIQYGTKLQLKLSNRGPRGQHLMSGKTLDQFMGVFTETTGRSLTVKWQGSSSTQRYVANGPDYEGVMGAIADLADRAMNLVVVVAAFETLFGD